MATSKLADAFGVSFAPSVLPALMLTLNTSTSAVDESCPATVSPSRADWAAAIVLFGSTSAIPEGGVDPPAASTAAFASTRPAPQPEHVAGNARALDFSRVA